MKPAEMIPVFCPQILDFPVRTITEVGAYKSVMDILRAQIVALVSSVALVLPPGWCQGLCPVLDGPDQETARCCDLGPLEQPFGSEERPNSPIADCCCSLDTIVHPKTELPFDLQGIAGATSVLINDKPFAINSKCSSISFHTSAIPIHVFTCVWRC